MTFIISFEQDIEPTQLLLFVQSFGIPVSGMSKLLSYLDSACQVDADAIEQVLASTSLMPSNATVLISFKSDRLL